MKDKDLKKLNENLKLELGKYHRLILPDIELDFPAVWGHKEFTAKKKSLISLEGQMNKTKEITDILMEVRVRFYW